MYMNSYKSLPPLSDYLLSEIDKSTAQNNDRTISVDPVVSEVATLYERFRNAMDYREDDVLLRAAIERIIKRRLLLGGTGKHIAPSLVRELLWARYFPENTVTETLVPKVGDKIDLYLSLLHKVQEKHKINKSKLNEVIMHLMSSSVARLLNPNREKELLANFMYQLYRDKVTITDDKEDTRDVQVFIAIRRTFAKEDLPLLRYNLFIQLFGELTESSLNKTSDNFKDGLNEIETQLDYPLKDKIYTFIKNQTISFFILEDVFKAHKGENKHLALNQEEFNIAVFNSCQARYKGIKGKVRRAIIRGVIFIFITKAIFALSIEGTYESLIYGKVLWSSIALNTLIPPFLMVLAGLLIKTPGRENSVKILERIHQIIYNPENLDQKLMIKKAPPPLNPLLNGMFILLWLLAFTLSFGVIIYVLSALKFNFISQSVFIFFLAIVSFISYRINQTANMYTISRDRQNISNVLFDFFFMPVIQVGRDLTENISKLNLFLFVFDFIIEAPFKGIFAFFEEWFLYLRTQREKLG